MQSPCETPKVKASRYKISPSQNAKHSVEITPDTPRKVNKVFQIHRFGMFGDSGNKQERVSRFHLGSNESDEDEIFSNRTPSGLDVGAGAKTPILISDEDENKDVSSGKATSGDEEATAAPRRSVLRDEILAAAAEATKKRIPNRTSASNMKTAYVDLSNEVAPSLDPHPRETRRGGVRELTTSYSRLQKRPYVLEEGGKAVEEADKEADSRVLAGGGERFRFVNWKDEEMGLAMGTGVVVIKASKE